MKLANGFLRAIALTVNGEEQLTAKHVSIRTAAVPVDLACSCPSIVLVAGLTMSGKTTLCERCWRIAPYYLPRAQTQCLLLQSPKPKEIVAPNLDIEFISVFVFNGALAWPLGTLVPCDLFLEVRSSDNLPQHIPQRHYEFFEVRKTQGRCQIFRHFACRVSLKASPNGSR